MSCFHVFNTQTKLTQDWYFSFLLLKLTSLSCNVRYMEEKEKEQLDILKRKEGERQKKRGRAGSTNCALQARELEGRRDGWVLGSMGEGER